MGCQMLVKKEEVHERSTGVGKRQQNGPRQLAYHFKMWFEVVQVYHCSRQLGVVCWLSPKWM